MRLEQDALVGCISQYLGKMPNHGRALGDVLLAKTAISVISEHGKIAKEAQVASAPEALLVWMRDWGGSIAAIGFEAGPLSHRSLAVEASGTRYFSESVSAIPEPDFTIVGVAASMS